MIIMMFSKSESTVIVSWVNKWSGDYNNSFEMSDNVKTCILWFKTQQWKPVGTCEGWLQYENGKGKKKRFAVHTHTWICTPCVAAPMVMPQEAFAQIYSFSYVLWSHQTSVRMFFSSYLQSLALFLARTCAVKHGSFPRGRDSMVHA